MFGKGVLEPYQRKEEDMKRNLARKIFSFVIAAFFIAALTQAMPAKAVDWSEWEYEAGEGLHQEEWYDPTDWFDTAGEGISYETDWYDYSYGYNEPYGSYGYYDYDYYEPYSYYGYYEPYDYDYSYYTNDWYGDEGLFDF